MIRVPADTPLTIENVRQWIIEFVDTELPNLRQNREFYRNEFDDGTSLELPYAKKLVTISTAATIGDGIDIKEPSADDEQLTESQLKTFKEIKRLFKRQIIAEEDLKIIGQGSTYGWGFELCYASNDEKPVPKATELSPLTTFVVFDNTVEQNSLYGVTFSESKNGSKSIIDVDVYDAVYKYSFQLKSTAASLKKIQRKYYFSRCFAYSPPMTDSIDNVIDSDNVSEGIISVEKHNMGRMPITMYFNNADLQADFEQVKSTILWRNKINKLAMDDATSIAVNLLTIIGNQLSGDSVDEKERTVLDLMRLKVLELQENESAQILSKDSSFNTIAVYGKDLDNKIFDLSMIIDFNSEEFSGNITGVALRLKLYPFKRLVANKDSYIEKLYRRRLKMYMHLLKERGFEEIDVGALEITIHRTWEEDLLELAQVIATLFSTSLFSDEYLIEKMPDGDYKVELSRKKDEAGEQATASSTAANSFNTNTGDYAALLRSLLGGNNGGAG